MHDLCVLFLHEKQISAAGDTLLDGEMKLGIAVQACILILNLGIDSYNDWVEVIVYPDEFMPRQEYRNEHGVVETDDHVYAGQAWLRGPVILAAESRRSIPVMHISPTVSSGAIRRRTRAPR